MLDRRRSVWLAWALAMIALVAITGLFHTVRGRLDPAHIVLVYLLIVLGGSVAGGRPLGLTLAVLCFLAIDYYFQPPFDQLAVGKPLDWMVLVSFLVTATVATQLLARAQDGAERARRRADEVAWLSAVGSETLSAGRAEDALVAIAGAIQRTLRLGACQIYRWSDDGQPQEAARVGDPAVGPQVNVERLRTVGEEAVILALSGNGFPAQQRPAGAELRLETLDLRDAHAILLPLRARARTVGVLVVSDATTLQLDEAQRRFLQAIAYYAALGVDRVRLVAEAEHAEALREADRLKDEVLASVSHDLRTPLTSIRALAEVAAERGDENAGVIVEQADRLSRLVGDLLDLSRIKAGALPVTPELNTAEDLIGAAIRQVSGVTRGRRIETSIDYTRPALLGTFDFVQSLRILTNLLQNALRYAPADTSIEVSVRQEGSVLVFEVADRGPGIPLAETTRIFEPFYRPLERMPDAQYTDDEVELRSAGLGLSIARRLAAVQHGTLEYSPRDGGGSLFTLTLPAAEHDVETEAEVLAKS
jgi:two-component system sensor histidine kinase KdpD